MPFNFSRAFDTRFLIAWKEIELGIFGSAHIDILPLLHPPNIQIGKHKSEKSIYQFARVENPSLKLPWLPQADERAGFAQVVLLCVMRVMCRSLNGSDMKTEPNITGIMTLYAYFESWWISYIWLFIVDIKTNKAAKNRFLKLPSVKISCTVWPCLAFCQQLRRPSDVILRRLPSTWSHQTSSITSTLRYGVVHVLPHSCSATWCSWRHQRHRPSLSPYHSENLQLPQVQRRCHMTISWQHMAQQTAE